jgi:hypothetical protein
LLNGGSLLVRVRGLLGGDHSAFTPSIPVGVTRAP